MQAIGVRDPLNPTTMVAITLAVVLLAVFPVTTVLAIPIGSVATGYVLHRTPKGLDRVGQAAGDGYTAGQAGDTGAPVPGSWPAGTA